MDTNYDWNVYVPNNKRTFPRFESRICVVYATQQMYRNSFLKFAYFCNGAFKSLDGDIIPQDIPLFWRYVERLPDDFKVIRPEKCAKKERDCEFEDDGYCMHNGRKKSCKYRKCVEEFYAVNY